MLHPFHPSGIIQPTTRRPPIETREIIAWIATGGASALALLFLFLYRARARDLQRLRAPEATAVGPDPVTKLLGRRTVLGILEGEVARCLRGDTSLGILMVAFDKLSLLGEEHGRRAVDAVLEDAALRVRNNVRIYDSVGRCGDEEFLVVLPDSDEQELSDIAERVRMMIERAPFSWKGRPVRVTVSIGGLTTIALDEKSADRLVRSADRLVKEASALGGNRVQITEPFELTDESSLGLALEPGRSSVGEEE